ncbi:transketolase family protein [Arenicellales bacterium IMCC57338]
MRRRFGSVIADLADRDSRIYVIAGDIGYRVFDEFRDRHPSRFINIGICEQSMIGLSAGLALEGLMPWVYTITPFLIERPFEQLKLDVDQQQANVKLIGYADYPTLGPTHSELDAKRLMQLLTNINSSYPKNGDEAESAIRRAYAEDGPHFISLKSDPLLGTSITEKA